jgi:CRISPR-associated protein Csm1
MTDRQIELIVGSLLHDIGKVVYRSGDGRNHSTSGYEYLKELEADKQEKKISDEVLECVRYHHGKYLKNAGISEDSLAYIVYFSDNVAAFSDRRQATDGEDGFDKKIPLDSVFNILNGNNGKQHYAMRVLNPDEGINYPIEDKIEMNESFYNRVIDNITDNLKGIEISNEYINSLLSVLEANLSYIPSSTSKRELADISLYDHVKMTAAIASCIEQYLTAEKMTDYKTYLLLNGEKNYDTKMFLLYSMDISGIQNFIYTVGESGALKGLRARSFYLEILMEHIIDELLEKLSLSRANLIYTGGGHCYILLPNTTDILRIIREYEIQVNEWLMNKFGTALYIGTGYAVASANAFRNVPEGSYSELYRNISKMISGKKAHRYSAAQIIKFNSQTHDGERECKVCRRIAILKDDKCNICNALERMSSNILKDDYFTVICDSEKDALPLPGERYLVADTKETLLDRMKSDSYVRCYTKNNIYTGKHVTTKIWVGDYKVKDKDTFEKLAESACGIKRIGILRADVDNLGNTFVNGFNRKNSDCTYTTLSRTASLSRQLSLFFKLYINKILAQGSKNMLGIGDERNIVIVYSGGDDVFFAGAWNDVIAAAIDLQQALKKFTQGTLTLSAGVGIYGSTYPISAMAKETAILEDTAKGVDGKNAVILFEEKSHCYKWDDFESYVIGEKLALLHEYLQHQQELGMSFLYHLTELLRDDKQPINTARYVYLLSRMEPNESDDSKEKESYRKFAKKLYEWSRNPQDKQQLITAIYLYVYLNRNDGEENGK